MRTVKSWLVFGVVAQLMSCVTTIEVPQSEVPSRTEAQAAWQRVLAKHVDDEGRVHFDNAGKDPDLARYVRYIAAENPLTHAAKYSGPDDILAEHLNAYNALAMYGVVQSGERDGFLNPFSRAGFFIFTKLSIGGQLMSLYAYENEHIRKIKEPRMHFALNCMSIGCPRLPTEPFVAERLQEQLQQAAEEFFGSTKHLQIDHDKKIVRVSEILSFFTEDFVKEDESLIVYINTIVKPSIPADYSVEFIPYDWALAWQPNAK